VLPIGEAVWLDTHVLLPEPLDASLANVFTGNRIGSGRTSLSLAELLAEFPIAVLWDK
jgi:maltooligosyltrehalose synthase